MLITKFLCIVLFINSCAAEECEMSTSNRIIGGDDVSINDRGMVFCYQNCSDLLWEKKCFSFSDPEKLLKFKAKAEKFQKILNHYNNLFKQWKFRTIFGNRMLFYLVPGGFSYLIN